LSLAKVVVGLFTEEDLSDYIELSQTEYESSITMDVDHIRWKHLDSPHGASTYIRLVVGDKVVGRALLQPRLIQTKTGQYSTACVADVLIDPLHRSPPTNFINLTNTSANISKFSSVFHTANERTEPFYHKLFRLPNPFSLRGYVLPTRVAGIFLKIIGYRINALDWFLFPFLYLIRFVAVVMISIVKIDIIKKLPNDANLSEISLKLLDDSGPLLTRTKSFLKWRLIDAPLWNANVYCIERKGQFLGYIATRVLDLNGLKHLVLIDFLVDTDISFFDRFALRLWLIRQAILSDVDALFTMINPMSKAAHTCVGFPMIRIPDKFLPHGTPIFFRANSDENKNVETDRMTHMTLADIDYF
jgi:hypothetical protein